MAQSNLLTDEFATPDYIDSLVLSNEQPTSIDVDYSANITSGIAHWAVWDKDSIPAVVDLAALQTPVGAVDSGSATITATGPQTTITPTAADTETVSYRLYIAWVDGADESLVYSVSFGMQLGASAISECIASCFGECIAAAVN